MTEAIERFENEDLESRSIEDAEHWLRVYSDLVAGLRQMRAYDDAPVVGSKVRRFEARIRFWDDRLRMLRRQGSP